MQQKSNTTFKCVLLTCADPFLADAAEQYTQSLFDVVHVSRYDRQSKTLLSEVHDLFQNESIDFLISFLCPVIIPESLLNATVIAPINFHPAPPEYPGVGSASYALYDQQKNFGCTAHIMEKVPDSGDILQTKYFPIFPQDTCETLFDRATLYTLLLYYEVLTGLAVNGTFQANGESWTRKAITRKQFKKWMTLSFDESQEEIQRKISALRHSRYPGPFIEVNGWRFELPAGSQPLDEVSEKTTKKKAAIDYQAMLKKHGQLKEELDKWTAKVADPVKI